LKIKQINKNGLLLCILTLACLMPLSGQYNFTASITEGCTPMKVKFTFLSTSDTIRSWYWDFGNGQTSTLMDPDTVIYETPGVFTPSLLFNNRTDLWIIKADLITVHHTVAANFSYYDSVTYNVYVFEHTEPLDTGTTYTFNWDIEGFPSHTGRRTIVTFPEMDTFNVSLTVTDNNGCSSTKSQEVFVLEDIVVQNVFTPNGDNINDYFLISSNGGFPLILRIFTRAGILVYENEGSTLTWDGKTASGQELNTGIYYYTIEALQGDPNKRFSKAGVLYMYK